MLHSLYGKKLRQTQAFTDTGERIPVTDIYVATSPVMQIKSLTKDGYWALQFGIGEQKPAYLNKPFTGHIKKAGKNKFPRFLREVPLKNIPNEIEVPFKIGEDIAVDTVLAIGDVVQVTGTSKAKGFAGGVKRHGFHGGSRTHGQSDRERAPGSIGQTTTPGRVYKGKRMAGHMGGDTVTIQGLSIVGLDKEKQIVRVKGLVPGRVNTIVLITKQ